ncbi:hypothetical protein ABTQ33_12840 (plasmid) [Paucilactobacillus suebicus]|uniref:Uncharacterized protein n=1 Tax=Paucilactobacillus suebicus DSM 5007 = KCTC 3549 TaxID=1423807 RepID=A0A0R1W1L6_9LACO|nr:hypothetical protein [Paucilactobacillus suebicus]KRM09369.1 hypothetical protein FD16_GL001829 [Paucilactobacillus suebicus DSM 5007 = KCTC 3549]
MVSRAKRTDYGLVSCQYERDVIAGIDRRYERERRAKQHDTFSLRRKREIKTWNKETAK